MFGFLFVSQYNIRSVAAGMRLCVALGLRSFHTIDVFHQVKCYGLAIRHEDGWSIVYVCASLPCTVVDLAAASLQTPFRLGVLFVGDETPPYLYTKPPWGTGKKLWLARRPIALWGKPLILLAGSSPSLFRFLSSDQHRMTSMNAENVLLTHFSARYPRMPPSVGNARTSDTGGLDASEPVVALAFDHTNLTIGSIP